MKKENILLYGFIGSVILFFGASLYFHSTRVKNGTFEGVKWKNPFDINILGKTVNVGLATTSNKGIDMLKKWEGGCRTSAYLDSANVPTIGYGHTKGVRMGDVITQSEGESLLRDDLEYFENLVRNTLKSNGINKIDQHVFDMLVSHSFNTGTTNASEHFSEWGNSDELHNWWNTHYVTAKGVKLDGLVNRRNYELAILKNGY